MAGIPGQLYTRLRQALIQSDAFDSAQSLRAVFVDARIAPWRDRVPEGSDRRSRVELMIDALLDRSSAQGERVLVLFVRALAEQYDPADALHHELARLADELGRALAGAPPPTSPGVARPAADPVQLRRTLIERLSLSELGDLAFDLGISLDDLPGSAKPDKARELIAYLQRRDRLGDLVAALGRQRPDIDLSGVYQG